MSRTRIYCFLIIVIVGIIKGTLGSYESSGNINYHGFNQTNKVMNNLNLIDRSNEDMHLTPVSEFIKLNIFYLIKLF